MKCPVCKTNSLESCELVESFNAFNCPQCHGNWIRHEDYFNWYKSTQESGEQDKLNESDSYLPVLDSKQAKLCPDCGRILIKFKVDLRLDFYVDHCGNCNGVWLDRNEWEMLKFHDLHNRMHVFFTDPWQKKLREDSIKDQLDKQYMNKFGAMDYEKLKKIKAWIDTSDKKNEILAFLLDENPYKI